MKCIYNKIFFSVLIGFSCMSFAGGNGDKESFADGFELASFVQHDSGCDVRSASESSLLSGFSSSPVFIDLPEGFTTIRDEFVARERSISQIALGTVLLRFLSFHPKKDCELASCSFDDIARNLQLDDLDAAILREMHCAMIAASNAQTADGTLADRVLQQLEHAHGFLVDTADVEEGVVDEK